jgi:hypothetical protein
MVFFGSYNAGHQVVDYGDPRAPRHVDFAIEPGTTAWCALYRRGYVYVGDMTRGLHTFSYPLPAVARSSARGADGGAVGLAWSGSRAPI